LAGRDSHPLDFIKWFPLLHYWFLHFHAYPSAICRCLTSEGPGWGPGQSGKELGLMLRWLQSFIEQHAAEVGRRGSGVLYNTDH
jgi:hypothetical protein